MTLLPAEPPVLPPAAGPDPAGPDPAVTEPSVADAAHGPLGFARKVPTDGYAWWYIDALSDDGRYGLTIIAFIGSVFSPWYARARRQGRGDPAHHICLNVVLSGPGATRWCMTERGRGALAVEPTRLALGPSALTWDGDGLTIRIDEWAVPLPRRVRGTVRVRPQAVTAFSPRLDPAGRHRWWPIAPVSRVEVDLDCPGLRWAGPGYLDSNHGAEPLEAGFTRWDWCRGIVGDRAAILYNPTWRGPDGRDGGGKSIAVTIDRTGAANRFDPPPRAALPPGLIWRVARETRSEAGQVPRVRETLLDAPFYTRSVIETGLLGQRVTAMHESLDLDRFDSGWVQMLLPFRVPRLAG